MTEGLGTELPIDRDLSVHGGGSGNSRYELSHAQPEAHVAGKIVDNADFFRSGGWNAWNGHCQVAGEQHGGKRFEHFAPNLLLDPAPRLDFLTLAAA